MGLSVKAKVMSASVLAYNEMYSVLMVTRDLEENIESNVKDSFKKLKRENIAMAWVRKIQWDKQRKGRLPCPSQNPLHKRNCWQLYDALPSVDMNLNPLSFKHNWDIFLYMAYFWSLNNIAALILYLHLNIYFILFFYATGIASFVSAVT